MDTMGLRFRGSLCPPDHPHPEIIAEQVIEWRQAQLLRSASICTVSAAPRRVEIVEEKSPWTLEVNSTSITAKMPIVGLELSSAARAGLTAFVAGVARTVAHKNVTINNLLPGYFDTEGLREGFVASAKRTGSSEDAIAAQWKASVPAKRFGTALEFGQTCAFLCSKHAGYITGQSILLDGGLYPSAF